MIKYSDALRANPMFHLNRMIAAVSSPIQASEVRGFANALWKLNHITEENWIDINQRLSPIIAP